MGGGGLRRPRAAPGVHRMRRLLAGAQTPDLRLPQTLCPFPSRCDTQHSRGHRLSARIPPDHIQRVGARRDVGLPRGLEPTIGYLHTEPTDR